MKKTNKDLKGKKLPFYLKPLEKTLETMTTSLLSYFYLYVTEIYKEPRTYEEFISCFHAFMASSQNSTKEHD